MSTTYSNEEERALGELRLELETISLLEKLESTEDHFLIRWLRARNLNVKNATQMLQKYVHWKETDEDYKAAHDSSCWIPKQIIVDEFKYKFTGVDHEGRPVLWMPMARYDLKGLLEAGLFSDCFRYCYQMMEAILFEIDKQRIICGATQFVGIIDCAELTLRKVTHVESMQGVLRFMKEFDAYYPEIMYTIYVLNAPWLFSTIFKLVKSILSSHTISKVNIFDSNEEAWKVALLSKLPASAIPEDYGGTAPPVLTAYHTKVTENV